MIETEHNADERRAAWGLIAGHGRSGTNWLMELLDLSPWTHCRNEPDELSGSPLARLPGPTVLRDADRAALDAGWDDAVAWTAARMGRRDPACAVAKRHRHEWARRLGLQRLVTGRRLRGVLGVVTPSLRGDEWLMPGWLGSRARLREATAVLKINQCPNWACYVLRHRPDAPVLHIVRHPAGFLDSWARRYVSQRDAARVLDDNRRRLRQVVDADPTWAERFGDIDDIDLVPSELWYWRYANETIWRVGQSTGRYHRVLYESLCASPVALAREAYDVFGLTLSDTIERRVVAASAESTTIAERALNAADAGRRELIDAVIADSPMTAWWDDTPARD